MTTGEFELVRKKDYIPEVEEQVRYFLKNTSNLPLNEVIYSRTETPIFKNPKEKKSFFSSEIQKIIKGVDQNMCGKMYFWYNYVWIKNIKGGRIRPEYRVCDNEWFKTVEEAQASEEWGVVCVKRRRGGFSWKEAADTIHDCITKPFSHIGINSKTERDSFHLFQKILFIYDNLPPFLKAKIGRKNGMHLEFFRTKLLENGEKKRIGLQTEITVVPPVDTAFEGLMLTKWVCDEAGKIPNLPQLWSFTEDCLMQEYTRAGMPILFGTSGDIATTGGGLMHMWDKAEFYKLKKFFFAGWMGIAVDEFGNDRKEEVIRWILYERIKKASIDPKTYNDFLQRYPLTIEEAFSQASSGIGDVVKLNSHAAKLRAIPPFVKTGRIRINQSSNQPDFVPERFGYLSIFEDPSPLETYIASCDPADHDDTSGGSSDLCMHVFALSDGLKPTRLVAEMCYRPKETKEFFIQAHYLAKFYYDSKILIENNRWGMIQYFKENELHQYLALRPSSVNNMFKKRTSDIGIRMTVDVKSFMEETIRDYIDEYVDFIPSLPLIQEFLDFGKRNTDRVMSFGIGLIYARDRLKFGKKQRTVEKSYNPKIPDLSYKLVNGRMVRLSNRNQTKYKVLVNE